jgi:methylmalonyl-CoA mutase
MIQEQIDRGEDQVDIDRELDLSREFPPPSFEAWKQAVVESLKGADYDKVMTTRTYEGITLHPIYRREDIEGLPAKDSDPGQAPFLRGCDAEGYTLNGWLVAQLQEQPSLEKLNRQLLDELQRGLNCINLKLHPDTRNGRLPRAGRGVPLSHLEDIKALLKGVYLDAVPVFMFADEGVVMQLGLLNAYAKSIGMPVRELSGCFGFDPIATAFRAGKDAPGSRSLNLAAQMTKWAELKAPRLKTLLLDASAYELAGASAVQELGIALATAAWLFNSLLDKGFSIDQIASRCVLKLSLGSNFFMEMAKVRTARMLWSELARAFGADEDSQRVHIHGVTAGFNKTGYDRYANLLRTSTEAFSGVIGGVDSLEVAAFDSLVSDPDDFSKRLARNQQLILAEEAHFTKVIDPAGGCYYIEKICSELADKAWRYMQSIEAEDGILPYLKSGKLASDLSAMAQQRVDAVHKRRDVVVGVNMFADPAERLPELKNADNGWLEEAADRLRILKQGVSGDLANSLGLLSNDLDNDFLIDMIADAWLHNADIGQISSALGLTGDYHDPEPQYAVKHLEALRTRVLSHPGGKDILLLNMGTLAEYKARADFSLGFLQTAGFKLANPNGFGSVDEALAAVKKDRPQAVCICSTDDNYVKLVPQLCSALKALPEKPVVILAGYPADKVEEYKTAGVDIFIHLRANLYDTLLELAGLMGVGK